MLEVVDHLDLSRIESRCALGGAGRRAYDPRMMLALLIYAYADGVRSSRQIERLCRTDVAMRVICGLQVPDHTAIARFRQVHQDSVRELFTQVLLVCAKAGLGRLDTIAIDGTKIAANASRYASCRREWLQEQVAAITAEAAAADEAEDATCTARAKDAETPQQLRGRQDREHRLRRALEEVLAEEAARGLDAGAIAAKHEEFLERTRRGDNTVGTRPVGVGPVAAAEARLQAAQDRLAREKAAKREQIEAMRERIRLFEAGHGPKPVLGPFSFDEDRGREVARAKRWVVRAENELARARSAQDNAMDQDAATTVQVTPGGGKRGPRGSTVKDNPPKVRRNITDPDSRQMQGADGGALQGYNAQLAVGADGLILACELVQDGNDRRQLKPMMPVAVAAALAVHQARCLRQCPDLGGCCIEAFASLTGAGVLSATGCSQTSCPCATDWIGTLLFDSGYWSEENLNAPGPDRLIAPGKARDLPQVDHNAKPPPEDADAATWMLHRLATEDGSATYKRRAATVEPINGQLKDRTRLRRFARRGRTACQSELELAGLVLNLRKFCRLDPRLRAAALAA
ncbi:transposase [Streptomyces malaysiensis]|uniref:transposase n=1 Tax=Streptomyces malaysiensis TaxID=92644 RepID=UPI00384EF6AF